LSANFPLYCIVVYFQQAHWTQRASRQGDCKRS